MPAVNKTTYQNLWPRINSFWKHDISSASERAFPGFLAIFLVAQLSLKRGVSVQKNSLASSQRCRHSVEPRALTCPFKHSDLIAWSILIGHPTHKYLWGRLCFVHVCCLLSTVAVTPAETRIMSTEVLLSKTVSVKIYTKRTRVRSCIPRSAWGPDSRGTKQLETVATRVIAATGSFYSAIGIDSQASVGAAGGGAKKRRANEKEISLVFETIMLHVLTYVVSNKLIWNWNGVVRLVSQEVWFDKGFVIWNFRNYCLVQIVSLDHLVLEFKSFSLLINW